MISTATRAGWGEPYQLHGGQRFNMMAGGSLPHWWHCTGISRWKENRWLALEANTMVWKRRKQCSISPDMRPPRCSVAAMAV